MKATELRIGNKFECMGMIQTVFEIIDNTDRGRIIQNGYEHLIACIENKNQYKPVEINPIPLTEEWLIKFGFTGDSIMGLAVKYSLNRIDIWYNKKLDEALLDNVKYKRIYIKYVHQLQNLYFVLTNEELIIHENQNND